MKAEKKREPSILDAHINQLRNHATLVGAGVSNESAMRATYGDESAEETMRMLKEIEEEKKC